MTANKHLVINMTAQLIAFVVNIAISFFLTPYIIEHVGKEAYGFVGLANNFTSYAEIVTLALNSMAGRFITIAIHRGNDKDASEYFSSVFFANLIICIPLTILSVFTLINLNEIVNIPQEILTDVTALWGLIFASFLIGVVGSIFSVATFAKNRLELASLRGIESNILRVLVLVVLYYFFKPHIFYMGISAILCRIYVIMTNARYTHKLLPSIKIKKKYWNTAKVKELLLSGMWNSFTKISGLLTTGLDLLISNIALGPSAMGMISISKTLPTYILSLFGAVSSVYAPQLTIYYAKEEYENIRKELQKSIRLLGFFACIPIACLFVYGDVFFQLWLPNENFKTLHLLTILGGLAFPLTLSLEPLWNIFTITNKVKNSSVALMIASVISVTGTFLLLSVSNDPVFKMCVIVGFSTIVGIVRNGVFLPIYGAKCLKLKWYTFYPIIFKVIFSVLITILISLAVRNIFEIYSWLLLFVAVAVTVILACVVNYFIMLRKEERKILKSKLFAWRRKK